MKRGILHPFSWNWACVLIPCLGIQAFVLLTVNCSAGEKENSKNIAEAVGQTYLVHYMPWFESKAGSGAWGKHWTGNRQQFDPEKLDSAGLPQLASHYHPLLGPYDSSDPAVIECHLLQMKLAGIDGVIVDWYGLSQFADYPAIHKATSAIFAATSKYGLKFAVCFEDRTVESLVRAGKLSQDQVSTHLAETFTWLEQNWFTAPQYFQLAGRPLVLNFGPIYVSQPNTWRTAFGALKERPAFFALHHLWNKAHADGGFTWVYPEVWNSGNRSEEFEQKLVQEYRRVSAIPEQTIVSAFPGFNDRYDKSYPDIAHREGATLRETFAACGRGSWPIVQLVTWNDFGEGTMIEPSHEFGYLFLEIVLETSRAGSPERLATTADDLRLPEKLYHLRKKDASQVKLQDEAAELLASGEANAARLLIERMSADSSAEDSRRSTVRPRSGGSLSVQLASSTLREGKRY